MTPSFRGRMATILPGVRPSISLASRPTASTSPLFLLIATIEGSLTTMPLPFAYTSVLAVPRSMARSEENMLKMERKFISVPGTCLRVSSGVLCRKLDSVTTQLLEDEKREDQDGCGQISPGLLASCGKALILDHSWCSLRGKPQARS